MLANKGTAIAFAVACAASAMMGSRADAVATQTLTFQQGVNGYTGETSALFRSSRTGATGNGDTLGVVATQSFVDGYDGAGSGDDQLWFKWANLIGSGPGQIPSGAYVINASLTLTTGVNANAQSNGPFAVSTVLVPWDTTTSKYNTLKAGTPAGQAAEDGLNYASNAITRPYSYFDDPTTLYGGTNGLESLATSQTKGTTKYQYTADITTAVRGWAQGTLGVNGVSINTGPTPTTTDGWMVTTGTNSTAANRPKISVTYTTANVKTASFQNGVNGYNGTDMAWLRQDGNINDEMNGASIDHAFLDGYDFNPDPEGTSQDDQALVKFRNIFKTPTSGTIPVRSRILRAELVVTTPDGVGNAQTQQVYETHQMLKDWSPNRDVTSYTGFGPLGPEEGDDIGPRLSAAYGMVQGGQARFDVTAAVESWRASQAAGQDKNYGLQIRAWPDGSFFNDTGTNDGWSIYFLQNPDASVHPQLLVSYIDLIAGDVNADGIVNAQDISPFVSALVSGEAAFATQFPGGEFSNADVNGDLLVNAQDISPFVAILVGGPPTQTQLSAFMAMVPEPTSTGLLATAVAAGALRRRRARA